eukprot:768067-Hanusia_phi.AAC.1
MKLSVQAGGEEGGEEGGEGSKGGVRRNPLFSKVLIQDPCSTDGDGAHMVAEEGGRYHTAWHCLYTNASKHGDRNFLGHRAFPKEKGGLRGDYQVSEGRMRTGTFMSLAVNIAEAVR